MKKLCFNSDPLTSLSLLDEYRIYIIIGFVALALIVLGVILFIYFKRKKVESKNIENESAPAVQIDGNALVDALGGVDNIVNVENKGNRIFVTLKNYDVIDNEKIKSNGVDSIIKMSNKLVLVTLKAQEIMSLLSSNNSSSET